MQVEGVAWGQVRQLDAGVHWMQVFPVALKKAFE